MEAMAQQSTEENVASITSSAENEPNSTNKSCLGMEASSDATVSDCRK